MASADSGWRANLVDNLRWIVILQALLVTVMVACVAVVIVGFGGRLQPGWQGGYAAWTAVFLALEAFYSRRVLGRRSAPQAGWLAYRGAEWVVLLLALKIVYLQQRGWNLLPAELAAWQEDFINGFFSGEFLGLTLIALIAWGLARTFSDLLLDLEMDIKTLELEREAGVFTPRAEVRRRLADLILLVGAGLVAAAVFMKLDLQRLGGLNLGGGGAAAGGDAPAVVGYFLAALVLMSITHLTILQARWSLASIPVTGKMPLRWALYTAGFVLLAALISGALPTSYSLGLLTTLRYLVGLIAFLAMTLIALLVTPILLLIGFILSLFGINTERLPQTPPEILPPAAQPPPGAAPNELLQSILFWGVFLAVAGFSIYQYLHSHQELLRRLVRAGGAGWLADWLRDGWAWLRRANHRLGEAVSSRLRRKPAPPGASAAPWGFLNLMRLSPRQKVIFYYLALVRRGGEQGYPRAPGETPGEYGLRLQRSLPELAAASGEGGRPPAELDELTGEFLEARYSRHEIEPGLAAKARRAWERLKRALRRRRGAAGG